MSTRAKKERRLERRPTLGQVLTIERARELAATDKGREALRKMLALLHEDAKRLHAETDKLLAGIRQRAKETAQLYDNLEAKAVGRRDAALAADEQTRQTIEAALGELQA